MKFKDYKESNLEEAKKPTNSFGKKIVFNRVQPKEGSPAVDLSGIPVDDSIVLGSGMVALKSAGSSLDLFEHLTGKHLGTVSKAAIGHMRKLV